MLRINLQNLADKRGTYLLGSSITNISDITNSKSMNDLSIKLHILYFRHSAHIQKHSLPFYTTTSFEHPLKEARGPARGIFEGVSTGVSPVWLVRCIRTGYITVAMASCPPATRAQEGPACYGRHFLPQYPGTFARCLIHVAVPTLVFQSPATVHRGSPPRCILTF